MKYYYNGVLLPEIPQDVLAEYPYTIIIKAASAAETAYLLAFATQPFHAVEIDIYTFLRFSYDCTYKFGEYYGDMESYAIDSNIYNATSDEDFGSFGDTESDTIFSLLWSNHDIPLGSADSAEIYMAASEPAPFEEKWIKVKQSTMDNIADAIRGKTGKTDEMLPEDMAEEVGEITADLTEISDLIGGCADATKEAIVNQTQILMDNANAATGNADTNLTDSVNTLIGGYGQGGGGGAIARINTITAILGKSKTTEIAATITCETNCIVNLQE